MASTSIRIVLVRPLYSSNLGLVCRVMKNFGFFDLVIVQPHREKVKTKTAFMYAKHSADVLKNARVVPTLEAAVFDCQKVAGTTGVPNRFHRQLKTCVPLSKFSPKIRGTMALVFGSEGMGLSAEESNRCDVLVHIPTNPEHSVLNLSHAVAVVLHSLSSLEWSESAAVATLEKRQVLEKKFETIVASLDRVNDKRKVALAFRRVLGRSQATNDEVQALMAALSGLQSKINSSEFKQPVHT